MRQADDPIWVNSPEHHRGVFYPDFSQALTGHRSHIMPVSAPHRGNGKTNQLICGQVRQTRRVLDAAVATDTYMSSIKGRVCSPWPAGGIRLSLQIVNVLQD